MDPGDQEFEEAAQPIPKDSTKPINSENKHEHPLENYIHEEVTCGEFPKDDLTSQGSDKLPPTKNPECTAWLKERYLIFPRDERYSFTFNTASLAQQPGLVSVQKIRRIEDFAKNLRDKGGFFFFHESYRVDDKDKEKGENKIFNGTTVFRRPDATSTALPEFSLDGMCFKENYGYIGEKSKTRFRDFEGIVRMACYWTVLKGDIWQYVSRGSFTLKLSRTASRRANRTGPRAVSRRVT
jgi:hypothetical protein